MSKETTCNAAFKTSWSWVGACEILGRCAHPQNCLDIWIGGVKIKHTGQSTHLTEIIIHFNICTCTHHKNMYVLYSLYTCLMPYPLQFDHSYMGVRTRVAHPNQSVSFWLFTSTAVGPTLWPQLCAMTAELNARRAILEDLNLDHVLCVWCGIYKHFIKYVYRFCWNFVEYIGYANGGFKAKVCTYLQYVPIQKTCDGHVSLFHNHLSQDFLNSYFTVRAESIRNSATHEVLSVPKEGPCSAEMVSWHRKIL